MAEFALGLTKTAVKETVLRVKSAIEEEANLRVTVQDDLVFITGEFDMMQSFLSASRAGERASKNQVVRTWVRQIRDLAFDVEDCVEFIIDLDSASHWDWVERLASSILVCTPRPLLPLDEAAADIKRLKARVEDVSYRNTRYNLITSGDGGSDDDNHNSNQQSGVNGGSSAAEATFQVLRKAWEDTGKLHDTENTSDLKKLIDCQGSELQVISLWGSPQADGIMELGWKAIAKKAYDDPIICREFKNRAWVKPAHPFNPVEFLNTLLTHFTSHRLHRHHDDMSELVRQVSDHKYLIIVEQELSSVADWEAIKLCLPDGNTGSRIVVSTRNLGIALACTREPYEVLELTRFFHDQYLYAFCPKGSGHRIGIGEISWQLRRPGVLSVHWQTRDEHAQMMGQLYCTSNQESLRVPEGVEHSYTYWAGYFNLHHMARTLLWKSYPEDEQNEELEKKLDNMSSQDKIERCRELLSKQDLFLHIERLWEPAHWDSIKRELLPEMMSTRTCIIVTTSNNTLATHCVGHDGYRALSMKELLKQGSDRGGSMKEEDKYEPDNLVGREGEKYERLLYGWKTSSVWGIAGVGKSALVRQRYKERRSEFYGGIGTPFGWVDVPHPFNLAELCRRLLLDIHSGAAKEGVAIAIMEGQGLIQWCSKIVREGKCVLVFDGLESKHDWDLIKATLLPQPIIGEIAVITREESIAKHCAFSKDHVYNIKSLEADAALDLFKKEALKGGLLFDKLNPEKQRTIQLLVPKCGGLPELIVAIGKFLIKNYYEITTFGFMRSLESLPDFSSLRGFFSWIQSYFDACSDELKPCIFYMSVFDADQSIRRKRLVRRWIAEGYSSGGGGTAEEKGEELLSELIKLSIVYEDEQHTSTKKSCKANVSFREYIKSRPMEDNLVFALEGQCNPSSQLTGRHLTISNSWDRDEVVFNSIDMSRLRSLTVFGEWKSFLTSEKMKVLRVLDLEGTNALDGSYVTDADLERICELLHRLKFLSLRGCQQINRLPDSLGDMKPLQTLDVRYTSIVELPSSIITKLHKLQYICAGTSNDTSLLLVQAETQTSNPAPTTTPPLKNSRWWQSKKQLDLRRRRILASNGGGVEVFLAPAEGLRSLTDMHTLGVVNVARGKGALLFLQELKKLTQLRKLRLSGINHDNWRKFCVAISGNLHRLESLSLQLMLLEEEGGSFSFACFDDIAEPPKTLKRLKVLYPTTGARAADAAVSIRPGAIKKIPNLERLLPELTISSQEDVHLFKDCAIQRVTVNGRRLRIKPIEKHLSFSIPQDTEYGWIRLDSLRIECSGTLSPSKVTFGYLVGMRVKVISIHCCCRPSVSAGTSAGSCSLQIADIDQMHDVKEIIVTGTYADSLKQDLQEQVDMHPSKPALKAFL